MLKLYGIIFMIGLIIQVTTSVTWPHLGKAGYYVFMTGQAVGELCYFICCRKLFTGKGLFKAVVDYAIGLIIIDIFTICFLDPFEISISKYIGFVVAGLVLLLRINKYR